MMWMLIVSIAAWNQSPGVTKVEMRSQTACEIAGQAATLKLQSLPGAGEPPYMVVKYACVTKDPQP